MWTRVAITPSAPEFAPVVAARMFACGAEGVHEDGSSFVTHLAPQRDVGEFVAAVRKTDARLRVDVSRLAEVDWSTKWREQITAHKLGTLTVAPPWLAAGLDPATSVIIEPAMAFGTGEHPTTRGVVRLMQKAIKRGDSVADLGAGSAILAIAAVKLGAARAFAIEHDHDSIANAEENVVRNGVAAQVAVLEGDAQVMLPLVAPVRIILANIISSALLELLPLLAASLAPRGQVILSGILLEERAAMLEALKGAGWKVEAEDREEAWWSVRVAR